MKYKNLRTYSKNFNDAQVERIVKLRASGLTWTQITAKLNKEFLQKNSEDVYAGIYRRFGQKVIDKVNKKLTPHPHEDFTREALGNISKTTNGKRKRFFITAVGAAAPLHVDGFNTILKYCEKEKAELVLLPMLAHVKALQDQPNHYDPLLKPYLNKFATEFIFNENIKAIELYLNPQQINSLTGLKRVRGRDKLSVDPETSHLLKNHKKSSLIVAHSKQLMETLPTGNNSVPRIIHSTGSITVPNYQKNRVGVIAGEDHLLGGLILEVNDDEFYITQVQINERDGSFVDKYAKRFYPNGDVVQERAEAFVMGDIHPGLHSQVALNVWYEVWDIIRPKKVFVHDWLDGKSISHHLTKKRIQRAMLPTAFKTLEGEMEVAKEVLDQIYNNMPEDADMYLVASNHPDHVTSYIDEGRYMKDSNENYALGHRMVVETLDGQDPIKNRIDPEGKFIWLERNQDFYVEGTQCASHGDVGANGSRGSIKQNEDVYSSSMTAHTHAPGIYHDAFVVGHTSIDRHGYNNGPSGWLVCSGSIYRGGHKQLVIALKSNWKI